MDFRTRLIKTLKCVGPVLQEPGVLIAGSEVPNLLEADARCTLVVSQDLDIAVPVESHAGVKARLQEIRGLKRSGEEPSVWLPLSPDLLEVNFIGMDTRSARAGETYVLEDDELPLLVFAQLSLLSPGKPLRIEGLEVPLPRPAGLLLEKLVTDRSGEKGERDLLVALALQQYAARCALSLLSLLPPHPQMPDPTPHRPLLARLLARLETMGPAR
jgi:hypothetical protein